MLKKGYYKIYVVKINKDPFDVRFDHISIITPLNGDMDRT